MRHARIGVMLVILSSVIAGCISAFDPVNSDVKFKPKSLAVVAGLDVEQNVQLAQAMSESLRKYTRFQVIPHKQAAQKIAGYPVKIQGPWKSAYFEIEVDYSKTDMKKVRSIQQQLGVDYLYVLWTPSETVYNRKIHSLNVIGQMFENGKEVGNGRFNATAGKTDCCLVPAPDAKDKADAMKDTADLVARQIGERTGTLKQ